MQRKTGGKELFFAACYFAELNAACDASRSDHAFGHLFSAEDMEMQMLNGLSGVRAAV